MLISHEKFKARPLLVRGRSKEIRLADPDEGTCWIKYLPTIYSYTANRAGVVEGSDRIRLEATRAFTHVLENAGIHHAYKEIGECYVLSEYLKPRQLDLQLRTGILEKANLELHQELDPLHGWAPNIETIVKAFHSGTTKHKYEGMNEAPVRGSHVYYGGFEFDDMDAYPCPIVRFDWRNPLRHPETNERMRDEAMCEDQADWYIDVEQARNTAMRVWSALAAFLDAHDIVAYDLCLFLSEDGKTVYGEISQDCGRFRHYDMGSLDKDVWRSGGSKGDVLEKWELLLEMIGPT